MNNGAFGNDYYANGKAPWWFRGRKSWREKLETDLPLRSESQKFSQYNIRTEEWEPLKELRNANQTDMVYFGRLTVLDPDYFEGDYNGIVPIT